MNTREIGGRTYFRKRLVCQRTGRPFLGYYAPEEHGPTVDGVVIEAEGSNGVPWTRPAYRTGVTVAEVRWEGSPVEDFLLRQARLVGRVINPWPPSEIEVEIAKLRELGLNEVADTLTKKHKPRPNGPPKDILFPPGEVFVSHTVRTRLVFDVLPALEDHLRGASCKPADELTEDEEFCPLLFGQGVQNAMAIKEEFGVVKTLHAAAPWLDKPRRTSPVAIWTIIGVPNVQTLIFSPDLDPL